MDPPTDLTDPQSILWAREQVLRNFRALDPKHDVVLGQFAGRVAAQGGQVEGLAVRRGLDRAAGELPAAG